MKSLIAALLLTATASAETLILPVQDLMFEVPNFTNAPKFQLGAALNGNFVPETPQRLDRKTKRELEKKLISIMWDEYPDAQSIRIWNGNIIVRMP
jgi:hypothetical protein